MLGLVHQRVGSQVRGASSNQVGGHIRKGRLSNGARRCLAHALTFLQNGGEHVDGERTKPGLRSAGD